MAFAHHLAAWLRIVGVTLLLAAWTTGAPAADQFSACKPIESAVFANRIHVRCETPVDGKFAYFAVPTTDPRQATRMLALMIGAELGDKFLNVLFDPNDAAGVGFDCAAANCRNIKGLMIMERVPNVCDIDNTRRGCAGFCAAVGNNDPICPGFCASHDDMRCPGNCTRHPNNPECQSDPKDPCDGPSAPHNPSCKK